MQGVQSEGTCAQARRVSVITTTWTGQGCWQYNGPFNIMVLRTTTKLNKFYEENSGWEWHTSVDLLWDISTHKWLLVLVWLMQPVVFSRGFQTRLQTSTFNRFSLPQRPSTDFYVHINSHIPDSHWAHLSNNLMRALHEAQLLLLLGKPLPTSFQQFSSLRPQRCRRAGGD